MPVYCCELLVRRTLRAKELNLGQQHGAQLAQNYVQCLQILIQAQAEVLVNRMELPADVAKLIRHLWFSLIPRTTFLDIDLDEM